MALFDSIIPTEPTQAEIKAAALSTIKAEVVSDAKAMLDTLDARHRMAFARVWNHPLLTPAEAVAALGTDAIAIFTGSSAIGEFLAAQYAIGGAEYTPPAVPEWASLVPAQDGSMSVVGQPPAPVVEPEPTPEI
jgi:hypothetical protein